MKKYAGIIVRCNNKVLLCKRNSESSLPGQWSCPAGSVEKDEDIELAAKREFFEETNFTIDGELQHAAIIKRYNRDGTVLKGQMHCFIYDSEEEIYPDLENAKDGDEHTECGYFSKEDLPEPMTEQFNKLLKLILND
jgi:ADP-ribose pyrophosphatase YjhB (NUDIX family)